MADEDDDNYLLSRSSSLDSTRSDGTEQSDIIYRPKQHSVLLNASIFERNTRLATTCVMASVVLERAAYYSLSGNLVYFLLAYMNYSSFSSSVVAQSFLAMTWISCFIGGVLGDIVLGRFRTIIMGVLLYVLGFAMLPAIKYLANPNNTQQNNGTRPEFVVWLIFALFVISLGEGCFKSNMSPFGADQLVKSHDVEMRTFFSYFYFAVNIGCFVGYSALTFIQQEMGFVIGYSIPCALLLLAMIVFVLPRKKNYHVVEPSRISLLKKIVKVTWNARRSKTSDKRYSSSYESHVPPQHWLDKAKMIYGGKHSDIDVEEIKSLFSVVPVLLFLVIYCTGYYQIQSTYLLQGIHMRVTPLYNRISFPACWLSLFNIVTVVVAVPIIDRYVYPCLSRLHPNTPYLTRIAIGMLFAIVSLYVAGVTEHYRLRDNFTVYNHLSGVGVTASDMTILYQIPQYALMGVSEVFVLIAGLEFAYCRSPSSMQSFVTSLFYIANGLGAILSTIFIWITQAADLDVISSGPSDDPTIMGRLNGHLDYYFYFLACLNVLNWLGFIAFAVRRNRRHRRKEMEQTVAAYIQGSMEASMGPPG